MRESGQQNGSGGMRALLQIVLGLVLITMSAAAFAWSSLGLGRPHDAWQDTSESSLTVYTNDPTTEVVAVMEFRSDSVHETDLPLDGRDPPDATPLALFGLVFSAPKDPEAFRWALVGRGQLVFDALMPAADEAEDEDAESRYWDPVPMKWAKSCIMQDKIDDQTVIVGGLGGALLLGTEGGIDVVNSVSTELKFPNLRATQVRETYTLHLGDIGRPQAIDDIYVGNAKFERVDSCLRFGKGEAVAGVGQLEAGNVEWRVKIPPGNGDAVEFTNADIEVSGVPEWRFEEVIQPTATFIDRSLDRLEQSLLFAGGILGGLGINFVSQGILPGRKREKG
jgi:hypothetical protein